MSLMMYWFMHSSQGLTAPFSSQEFYKYEMLLVTVAFSLYIGKSNCFQWICKCRHFITYLLIKIKGEVGKSC